MKNRTKCRSAIGLQLKMHMGNLHSESLVLLNSYWKNINCRCKRMQNGTLQLWNLFKFKSLMSNAQLQMPFPYGEEKHMQLLFSLGPAGTQGDGGLTQL
jgi:hypothetical protein